MAQVSTPTPTPTASDQGEQTEIIKQSTAQECRDAFARVPVLERQNAELALGKANAETQVDRLARSITELNQNFLDYKKESKAENAELRAAILKLVEIASKRTKICLIC